ncbi:caspase-1-like, partial [Sander lucioperca]|uniref:caspase-1-like n=1 Tax=Sander lucioperca TaxID=283035 RepID=UPI00125DAFB7
IRPGVWTKHHPTFEIRLPINTPEVTLRVQDEGQSVWEHDVELIGPAEVNPQRDVSEDGVLAEDSDPPEDKLLLVRSQFIIRVSDPVLNQLLDNLLEHRVITDEEMQSVRTRGRADKARDLMDSVRRKGRAASSVLISALCELDPVLSRELRLI